MNKNRNTSFNYSRIRQIREFRKRSQQEVAQYLNISQSSYNELEQGHTKLKVETLELLVLYFNVDIRNFFETELPYDQQLSLLEENRALTQKNNELSQLNAMLEKRLKDQCEFLTISMTTFQMIENRMRSRILIKRFLICFLLILSCWMFIR